MGRIKIESPGAAIKSWDEADMALNEIAVLKSKCAAEDAKYNEAEQIRRKKITENQQDAKNRIAELEIGLKDFCENNRQDFGKLKSRELQHGIVSFRQSPPAVKTLKGFTIASAMELVKRSDRWRGVLIRTKEELNKEEILTRIALEPDDTAAISDAELKSVGLQIVRDETFGYDTKLAITVSNN